MHVGRRSRSLGCSGWRSRLGGGRYGLDARSKVGARLVARSEVGAKMVATSEVGARLVGSGSLRSSRHRGRGRSRLDGGKGGCDDVRRAQHCAGRIQIAAVLRLKRRSCMGGCSIGRTVRRARRRRHGAAQGDYPGRRRGSGLRRGCTLVVMVSGGVVSGGVVSGASSQRCGRSIGLTRTLDNK